MITATVRSWRRCHIARSRRFNWPWSTSILLLAYRSQWCQAAGTSSSSSFGYTGARSVTTPARRRASGDDGPLEELPRRGAVPPGSNEHVDDLAILVHRPMHVAPPATDLDVRLVDIPTITDRGVGTAALPRPAAV
jgi:hypothetical protein